jgi:hypothetical protein
MAMVRKARKTPSFVAKWIAAGKVRVNGSAS